ncbi:hypothetical protein [Methylocapsa palsarum]|uniref:Uncharacterized protein n=1 Tax=Methylocapsa palsarum TaxID=1612308 RepID=A0A1I3YDY2_9HYPH|nr:hypothetical protein [Methylocapsa palsarum]SFK30157.1 hypothetical protein SAMN05444581_105212 [Methylocapsa palsarum]
MDREKSALLAAWLSFGANILTLCVAIFGLVVGAFALLSINQIRNLACESLSIACGFDAARAALIVFDVLQEPPKQEPPKNESNNNSIRKEIDDLGPPGDYPLWESLEHEAWRLLISAHKSSTGNFGDFYSSPEIKENECFQYSDLNSYFRDGAIIAGRLRRWNGSYLQNKNDNACRQNNDNACDQKEKAINSKVTDCCSANRSLGVEFTASYKKLKRDIQISLILVIENKNIVGEFVLPLHEIIYPITLPKGSHKADFLCPIVKLVPGQYVFSFATSGEEGDWNETLHTVELTVEPADTRNEPAGTTSSFPEMSAPPKSSRPP